ncbi:S1 family peptidase [Sinorhizobium psoraleae]|uniref:Serine protease n=1 Tax=Sinorhizobium psoraleae TaxID=520838 RepID=A0ABT4KN15_9HYPH|nr:serine protease [Sinorhizobium psoraleae]MCZ4093362.1 serine protease [Sinorhizobium psoraleae]
MKMSARIVVAGILAVAVVMDAAAEEPKSSGIGFAVTADGWLMTNAHVVDGCDRVEVKGRGAATDPRIDATNDLALIKVNADTPMVPLSFRRAPIRLGEDIVAIGYPPGGPAGGFREDHDRKCQRARWSQERYPLHPDIYTDPAG